MSPNRKPMRTMVVAEIVLVIMLVAAAAVVIGAVRRTAPDTRLGLGIEPALAPEDPAAEFVTCERTLPEASTLPADRENIVPVGRVKSSAIYECPDLFDGHVVVYIGEVVGDVLRRDGGAWVLMNDDAYALEVGPLLGHREFRGANSGLSVWLPERLVELVEHPGGSDRRGDVLRLRGVVLRADPSDGGGLTFRAIDGRRIADAVEVDDPLNGPQAIAAVLIAIGAVVVAMIERNVARRR